MATQLDKMKKVVADIGGKIISIRKVGNKSKSTTFDIELNGVSFSVDPSYPYTIQSIKRQINISFENAASR